MYFTALFFVLFNAVSEWLFWDEFSARFNFLAVNYLVYTQELVGNIWESYPIVWVLLGLAAGALAILLATRRWLVQAFESTSTFRTRLPVAAVFLGVPILAALFVSLGWSNVSENQFTNEIAKNGLYSFMVALRTNILAYDDYYATEDLPVAFDRVRGMLRADNAVFADQGPRALSTRRRITGDGPEKHANVVYIVVESLSAEYLGLFGNREGLSPNLDKLSRECLFFSDLRATGTRTDRGIEAVALSLPPTPGQSVIKRDENTHLYSIGPLFRSRGYETKFIYGGKAYFDRMDSFFAGNGFEVIDRKDFAADEVTFSTVWGHCDEDLFRRVLKECDKTVAAGKPFCTVALTTSNHRPFLFPKRVENPPAKKRWAAVQYTDFAIGDFLAKARGKPWFDDTVFVIVADHCASSAGKTAVQADRYHIPLFIYSPKLVRPAVIDRLCSQMDITPTLLGLLGWTYDSEFFGIDLLKPGPGPERAFVGNYDKVGLLTRGQLTLLTYGKNSLSFKVRADGDQTECRTDPELLKDTIGYYQAASYLLKNHLYSDATQTAGQSDK